MLQKNPNELKWPTEADINALYEKLKADAKQSGYFLNPDMEFTLDLVHGLLVNQKRYGYMSCPCRLTGGSIEADQDIVCPCDYRDEDLNAFNTCFCALYVTKKVLTNEVKAKPIPERRLPLEERKEIKSMAGVSALNTLSFPVWRCRVCGYLCARENPPELCPVCKAGHDRFERFI